MSTQDTLDRIARRADLVVDTHFERARRDAARMRADDALELEEQREKARKDRVRNVEHQSRYDSIFAKHGARAPSPVVNERPPAFRRRLFSLAQSLLPSAKHPLAKFRADSIDGSAIAELERQLLRAVEDQATHPTGDNIPRAGEPLKEVTRVDDATGYKETSFYGQESFIKGMGRPGRRVIALHDRDGRIIYPPRARGL
jgi:hypothetical protein